MSSIPSGPAAKFNTTFSYTHDQISARYQHHARALENTYRKNNKITSTVCIMDLIVDELDDQTRVAKKELGYRSATHGGVHLVQLKLSYRKGSN
jgi:hypothetical protein